MQCDTDDFFIYIFKIEKLIFVILKSKSNHQFFFKIIFFKNTKSLVFTAFIVHLDNKNYKIMGDMKNEVR